MSEVSAVAGSLRGGEPTALPWHRVLQDLPPADRDEVRAAVAEGWAVRIPELRAPAQEWALLVSAHSGARLLRHWGYLATLLGAPLLAAVSPWSWGWAVLIACALALIPVWTQRRGVRAQRAAEANR
ncbi:hypothetical protein [Leucobacter chromiireducens]|uniref:DUF3040 domain-containing protein n=1 Tax=Leucobacter chromiireducens subsp. solipictus TaxID=398235 RepID=A0ABS1SC26_9MICO|nr:hypothetical protein [Leucobacter chromiireducens]MBL3678050.1 hypothetical protein [Leucobacter chromiireducens subsp. solipictus]